MTEKQLISSAKVLSVISTPFYAPIWAFLGMFLFSYLKLLPWAFKVQILIMVWLFTVFIPRTGINFFRVFNKWTHWQMSHRENRFISYSISLLSYMVCIMIMTKMNVPMFIRGVILASLVSQIVCMAINVWWKVSTHMMAMGGLMGVLVGMSYIFYFNPAISVCLLLLLSGCVGTARLILRQHTPAQLAVGYIIGFVFAMVFVMLSWM